MGLAAREEGARPTPPPPPPPCPPARNFRLPRTLPSADWLRSAELRAVTGWPGLSLLRCGCPPSFSCRGGFLFARVCVRDNERGLLGGIRAAGKGDRGFGCLTEGQAETGAAGPLPSRKHRRVGVKCPVTAEGLRLLCPPLISPLPFGRAGSARMLSGSHPLSVYMGRDWKLLSRVPLKTARNSGLRAGRKRGNRRAVALQKGREEARRNPNLPLKIPDRTFWAQAGSGMCLRPRPPRGRFLCGFSNGELAFPSFLFLGIVFKITPRFSDLQNNRSQILVKSVEKTPSSKMTLFKRISLKKQKAQSTF